MERYREILRRGQVGMYISMFVLGGLFLLITQRVERFFTPCHTMYSLINPNFRCVASSITEWSYEPLRDDLITKITALQKKKSVAHVSVYFRDLTRGPRFGIEEYEKFIPGSLLKVPLMLAVLHEADRNPALLDQPLAFSGAFADITNNFERPEETIQPNTPYTVRELLRKMIVYSDNLSKDLLTQKLAASPLQTVYDTFLDTGVAAIMAPETQYVSIQSYATLFAVLYNRGYLSGAMSQLALELLSSSTFRDGLVAGVPADVRVAHKFGVRMVPKGQNQLHDCGIVYHPSATYILCVMTTGTDVTDEAAAIADVSRATYDAVGSVHRRNP